MPNATISPKIRISYDLQGNSKGRPVILVHGHGSQGNTYVDLIRYLEKQCFLLTFDLRGHGSSVKPIGVDYAGTLPLYTIDQFVADLRSLIDVIHFPSPFNLLGHSMGGMIAQVFAIQHPSIVSHLILCSTSAYMYTEGRAAILQQLKDGTFQLDENFYRSSCRMTLTRPFQKLHPEIIERSVQSRLLVAPHAYIGSMENFIFHYDTRSSLGDIRIPTLILTGEQDAIIKSTNSIELQKGIQGSRLVVIPKQNHGIIHEVPEVIAAEIQKFLTEG